jgi:hypothetical protein
MFDIMFVSRLQLKFEVWGFREKRNESAKNLHKSIETARRSSRSSVDTP